MIDEGQAETHSAERETSKQSWEDWLLGALFLRPVESAPYMKHEFLSLRGRRILDATRATLPDTGVADAALAAQWLRKHSNGTAADDIAYLAEVLAWVPDGANTAEYARLLAQHHRQHQAALAARAAAGAIEDGESPGAVMEHLRAAADTLADPSDMDGLPEPLDLAEVLSGEIEPVPWAVHGLFAVGDLVIVGGEPGAGKSMLALDLALAMAAGTPWLGMPTAKARILYVDEENQPHVSRRRIRQMMAGRSLGPGTDLTYMARKGLTLRTPDQWRRFRALCEHHRPTWVILDSLIRFHDCQENASDEMAQFLGPLRELAAELAFGLVILHHLAKPSKDRGNDPAHRLRGSGEILAVTDAFLALEGDRQSTRRTLTPCRSRSTDTLAGSLSIVYSVSQDGSESTLTCDGTESQSAEEVVTTALLGNAAGILRKDLEALIAGEGYGDPVKATSRALGKLTGQGSVLTSREGRNVRCWHKNSAPIGAR